MNTVAEAFVAHGLQIGVDIHYRAWVEGLDDCRLLLDSMPCPNAGIILNIGHMTTAQSYGWLLVDEYPGAHSRGGLQRPQSRQRPVSADVVN